MNLTDELKDRLLSKDYQDAEKELKCIDTLFNRIRCQLELGRIEDALEWLPDVEKSIKRIKGFADESEAKEAYLTTQRWLERVEMIRHV